MEEKYKLYAEDESYKLYQGKMQDVIDNCLEENSIDCIITDPPYGLTSITDRFGKEGSAPCQEGTDGAFKRLSKGFMGQTWDGSGVEYDINTWKRCLKVLKPGGYLLSFAGVRTQHKIATAIENAGFEIRDVILYLYGSSMPKALDVGLMLDKKNGVDTKAKDYECNNEWKDFKTSLKPCYEPIIVARKPFKDSVLENMLKYRTGALNIGECRVGDEVINTHNAPKGTFAGGERDRGSDTSTYKNHEGRYPGNVIHDGSEEATQFMPNTKGSDTDELGNYGYTFGKERDSKPMAHGYNDEGSAARYFYTSKASSKDRDEGLEDFENGNIHPTVKPVDLCQYLVRLVAPKGATILDCFMGSGSTGKAVMFENRERNANYKFIGIEMTPEYLPICEARIKWAKYKYEYEMKKEEKELLEKNQNILF